MTEPVRGTTYKTLIVYQKAKGLAVEIIRYFSRTGRNRQFEFLINQLLRAASSIGANVVEGYGRHYKQNFRQFISIARGSSFETEYWLEVILELGVFEEKVIKRFLETNQEIMRMLTTLMRRMEVRRQS